MKRTVNEVQLILGQQIVVAVFKPQLILLWGARIPVGWHLAIGVLKIQLILHQKARMIIEWRLVVEIIKTMRTQFNH